MVSGELIRLKGLVDDWGRVARVVRREYPRLEPSEQADLLTYIREHAPGMEAVVTPKGEPASATPEGAAAAADSHTAAKSG